MKGYVALAAAIVAELFATSMLKMSAGFTNLTPSLGVVAGYGAAFYLMAVSLKSVPLSLAYAIWSGVGTVITCARPHPRIRHAPYPATEILPLI